MNVRIPVPADVERAARDRGDEDVENYLLEDVDVTLATGNNATDQDGAELTHVLTALVTEDDLDRVHEAGEAHEDGVDGFVREAVRAELENQGF